MGDSLVMMLCPFGTVLSCFISVGSASWSCNMFIFPVTIKCESQLFSKVEQICKNWIQY